MNLETPERHRRHLRVGTCSWKYDSWKGLLYDEGRKYHADDYLVDYSRSLSTVEVDQWFWSLFPAGIRMPDPKVVSTYAASVPRDFVFSVKAPNSITLTHYYAKQPERHRAFANKTNPHFLSTEIAERFLASLEPLRGRLGPVMFQFEYLNAKKMSSPSEFYARLDAFLDSLPSGYQYAVEVRNPNFLSDEFFSLLRRHAAAPVLLDGYYMPPPSRVVDEFDIRTSTAMVLRLHGRDRAGVERATGKAWNRIVQDQAGGIQSAAEVVRRNSTDFVTTYVNVNNHYEGSAPLTIERFLRVLETEDGGNADVPRN